MSETIQIMNNGDPDIIKKKKIFNELKFKETMLNFLYKYLSSSKFKIFENKNEELELLKIISKVKSITK